MKALLKGLRGFVFADPHEEPVQSAWRKILSAEPEYAKASWEETYFSEKFQGSCA